MKNITPLDAIKKYCSECCGTRFEVKNCVVFDCKLHPFRLGHDINIQDEATEKQLKMDYENKEKLRGPINMVDLMKMKFKK